MNNEALGRKVRKVVSRQPFATIGVLLAMFAVAGLVMYWISPDPTLQPIVSVGIPAAVVAYLAVAFTLAVRQTEE